MKNELGTIEQLDAFISNETAAIIYFYNDHCAPCLSLRPKVIKLTEENFPKMALVFVNSEKYPKLPARFSVFSNPTLILFFEGKEFRRESKYVSIPQLKAEIERPYSLIFDN